MNERTRRAVLSAGLTAGIGALAGCPGTSSDETPSDEGTTTGDGTPALTETAMEGTPEEEPTAEPPDEEQTDESLSTSGTRWEVHTGLTDAEYGQKSSQYVDDEGLRLVDVSGYTVDGQPRFAAIWADLAGPAWAAERDLTPSEYQTKFRQYQRDGYRPVVFDGYDVDGSPRFVGKWAKFVSPRWFLNYDLSSGEYQTKFDQRLDEGFRPVEVTGYENEGTANYGAIWVQFAGPGWYSHHGMDASTYQQRASNYANDGFRLTDVSGFEIDGTRYYTGVWQRYAEPSGRTSVDLTGQAFQNRLQSYDSDGYEPEALSGYGGGSDGPLFAGIGVDGRGEQSELGPVDEAVATYMREYGAPGLSLAIAKDERLVFAKGYGYANLESDDRMRADTRLRIASISKPITGVAVLQLLEDGKLALDDEVFGSNGILGTTYGTPDHGYTSGPATNITVHHLLQHTSGWTNRGETYDPMFEHPNKSQDDLIRWVLDNMPLKEEPGTNYTYLNFGYCLLGRIIETVSGDTYEQYVTDNVLKPAGIDRMEVAGDTRQDRRPDEAAYYAGAYDMRVARMDSMGGWLGTPTDLLRFVVRVDGFSRKSDILGSAAMQELTDDDGVKAEYGEGWLLRDDWRGHNGSLPGTIGFLVRRDDGISYAVLANTRPGDDKFAFTLRDRLDNAVENVAGWPSRDLF
jgi:CubicO group peptidase (beta-lactamase class C family)